MLGNAEVSRRFSAEFRLLSVFVDDAAIYLRIWVSFPYGYLSKYRVT